MVIKGMMTLSKLAQLANVSVSTASKAFSMSDDVSEETRNHVFAVARKYGCLRKFYNREFYVPVVAVVCPDVQGEYAAVLSCISRCLSENGCFVSITTTNHLEYPKKQILDFYSRYSKVDAMIMVEHTGFPEMPNVSLYPFDYQVALPLAVSHLKSDGIKDIALVGWRAEELSEVENYRCFSEPGELCLLIDKQKESPPEAVICKNNILAMSLIRCCENTGVKIPEQIKIIGMDCSNDLPHGAPELTTIDFHVEENCRMVVEKILKKMDAEACEELTLLPPELVKGTTA